MTINGEARPEAVEGEVRVAWLHRDRLGQADRLVDQTAPSVGPEAGVTYTVRWYLDGALVHTEADTAGDNATYAPEVAGMIVVEVQSVRDGLVSLQTFRHSMNFTPAPPGP